MASKALLRTASCFGALVAGASMAAETAPGQPRELLQPPKEREPNPINDRFAMRGIYYLPSLDTPLRNDRSDIVPGTLISAEDTLGMDDQLNQGTIELMWRLQPRHRLRADYYKMKRQGDAVMDEVVIFGDATFLPGERVTSDMDLRVLGLTYTYSVLRMETFELGIGAGLELIQINGEAGVPARFVGEEFDAAGPFGTLAVDATWNISKRFSFNMRAQYLSVNSGETDGSFGNLHTDVQFRAWPNLAFGLGFTLLSMKIFNTEPGSSGSFELEAKGPEAFVRVSF